MTSMKYMTRVLPALAAAAALAGCGSANLTVSQQNAGRAARNYLAGSAFSKQGLIAQLQYPAGHGYSVQDATVAVDGLNVDWTAQAVKSAKEYLQYSTSSFSCSRMTGQLSYAKFTASQAQNAATKVGLC
jgi:hypothetical protein